MGRFIVEKKIRINAEPSKVWQVLTDPEKTEKYFFHARVKSDWTPGSSITFSGKMFYIIPFKMEGSIINAVPGKFLKYTLKNGKKDDSEAGTSTVTDLLRYENGQTIVSITDDVGDGEGAEKRFKRSQKGWDKVLAGLKKTVEEG